MEDIKSPTPSTQLALTLHKVIAYHETPHTGLVVPDIKFGHLLYPQLSTQTSPLTQTGQFFQHLPKTAPPHGEDWTQIHADFTSLLLPHMTCWNAPTFAAFFPGSTSYPSILGEMYAASLGGSMFSWVCSPTATELEYAVLNWLGRAMSLPESFLYGGDGDGAGGGMMVSLASETILTVMTAARDRAIGMMMLRRGYTRRHECHSEDAATSSCECIGFNKVEAAGRFVVLGSDTTHSSSEKAARILGLKYRSVAAPREDGFSMTARALEEVIDDCHSSGLYPIFVTATIGKQGDGVQYYIGIRGPLD